MYEKILGRDPLYQNVVKHCTVVTIGLHGPNTNTMVANPGYVSNPLISRSSLDTILSHFHPSAFLKTNVDRSMLMLSSHLLGLANGHFTRGFSTKILYAFLGS
jgi:hypothetical protein